MGRLLLDCTSIDIPADVYLRSVGEVFAEFGDLTQDSGNLSYGVQIEGERHFVKTAGRPEDPRPFLTHEQRVELLRNAARLYDVCNHFTLPRLYRVIESPAGPMLVYEWIDGDLVGTPRALREEPGSAFQRFRRLPSSTVLAALDAVYDLHNELARLGWIAVDFYDGCLIYDFVSERLRVVDLDMYRQGPFQNKLGRLFGSSRFMAPEEFKTGALIDEQTNVFVMGRTALIFLSDGTDNPDAFRASRALLEVIVKACAPVRSARFDSMASFYHAWREARKKADEEQPISAPASSD